MQKAKLIELIQHRLSVIDETIKYDYNIIEAYADLAWQQLIHDTYRKNTSNLDFYAKEYKNTSVAIDTDTLRYYSTLPANILQLPNRSEGVRHIHTIDGETVEFVPVSEDDYRRSQGLYVGTLDSTIGYIVRDTRVDYDSNMTALIASADVTMKLVIPFEDYDETDQITIPEGKAMDFMQMVVAMALDGQRVDLINNNSDV